MSDVFHVISLALINLNEFSLPSWY